MRMHSLVMSPFSRKHNRLIDPLTAVTAIWWFDAITHVAIHQTRPDKFLTRFDTQCAYSKT